jgi:hypothetical protein
LQIHLYFIFLHVWYFQSQIRWQITNIKRNTCIGIRPIDSRVYVVNSSSPVLCLICNYLRSTRYLLILLREYTLKVHVFVSSEHTLSRVIYVLIILFLFSILKIPCTMCQPRVPLKNVKLKTSWPQKLTTTIKNTKCNNFSSV